MIAITPKKPRTGGEIDAWCTKCRMDLNHRIVAMVGDAVKRVECLTCGGQHNYRKPASERDQPKASTPRAASGSSSRASGGAQATQRSARLTWEKAIAGQPPNAFKPYTVAATWSPGDLVRHKSFGDGVIARIIDPKKVEILFEEGPKTMAQGS
jgi:hypothetical protein